MSGRPNETESEALLRERRQAERIAHIQDDTVPCTAVPPEWKCDVCGRVLIDREAIAQVDARRPLVFGIPAGTEVRFPYMLDNLAFVELVCKSDEHEKLGEFYRAESRCRREA